MSPSFKISAILIIGLLMITGSTLLIYFFPSLIEHVVSESLNLEAQKGLPFENWAKLSLPLTMKYYFFDVQNSDDVVNHGAKPKLQEKGPYTFSETREKINIQWHDNNNTVSYYQTRTYKFERSESIGDIEDFVTIPNVPAISIAVMGKNETNQKRRLLAMSMSGLFAKQASLYMTKSVRELIFDGYFDSFIKTAQGAAKKEILPNHTFAFFYGLNDTHDGQYTVFTGKDDVKKYSMIKEWKAPKHQFKDVDEWNRYDKLRMWDYAPYCSDINGTDGQQFPPFIRKNSRLYIFISEMCRSSSVVYQKEVEHRGIKAYRFVPDTNIFADPSVNSDNQCFCSKPENCMYTGTFDVGKCQRDAPIFVSFPHFYQADPLLLRTVEGLKPDPERHVIVLDIEPLTGTPINAVKASQINVKIEPMYPDYAGTEHINAPKLYHPVLWFSETGTLNAKLASEFKAMAVIPVQIGTGTMYTVLALGIILILCAFALCIKRRKFISGGLQLNSMEPENKENHYTEVKMYTIKSSIDNDSKTKY